MNDIFDIDALREALTDGVSVDELMDEFFSKATAEKQALENTAKADLALEEFVDAWNNYVAVKYPDPNDRKLLHMTEGVAEKMLDTSLASTKEMLRIADKVNALWSDGKDTASRCVDKANDLWEAFTSYKQ